MPRCLMAKKWKYPFERDRGKENLCYEINNFENHWEVVTATSSTIITKDHHDNWEVEPSSPTAGAMAPAKSPSLPHQLVCEESNTVLSPTNIYNDCLTESALPHLQHTELQPEHQIRSPIITAPSAQPPKKYPLPPKKNNLYRPYCFQSSNKCYERQSPSPALERSVEDAADTVNAILDLSQEVTSIKTDDNTNSKCKTIAYTYEAFFISDGRSKTNRTVVESPIPSPTSKQRYICGECGKKYATSSNLSRHKQTHRSLDSQSAKKCNTCGKAYVSMPALAMHVLTHSLSHACNVCGKAFSRPWLLQGHMRSHTGEKPYGCAHCGKSFADRSNLRAHMQTHTNLKSFQCNRCNKTFALKSYLNKHYDSSCFKEPDGVEVTHC